MTTRLTEFSPGAGCGCKISPKVLDDILRNQIEDFKDPNLLIGNDTRDDAAVYAIDGKRAVISTTDFFMPIVDDPYDFGAIAAVNALSDVYAMGGKPLMAISILGWPVNALSPEIAGQVMEGARNICSKAGIPLAGGHSIDSKEPIFGLAVTGKVEIDCIKSNNKAVPGCELYLTKPLGVGIVTTAQKKKIVEPEDLQKAVDQMLSLNDIGTRLGRLPGVKAMTDVTGFGLLGHLIEICEGSHVSAEIDFSKIPVLPNMDKYIAQKSFPGGTHRNFNSYKYKVSTMSDYQKVILCDPQTSGGLLIAVIPEQKSEFIEALEIKNLNLESIGKIVEKNQFVVYVK